MIEFGELVAAALLGVVRGSAAAITTHLFERGMGLNPVNGRGQRRDGGARHGRPRSRR